jgi:predicted nuclease of predicted toxin-antitoxin system
VRILFDQGVPAPLRHWLAVHTVETAYERGWSTLTNGDLIRAAEGEGFQVFVTTDGNLKYQQNLAGRRIAIVAILSTSWPKMQRRAEAIAAAIAGASPGAYSEFPL